MVSEATDGRTVVVGAGLAGLVLSHNQASLAICFVLEEAKLTLATLLPLGNIGEISEQLSFDAADLILVFVCYGADFLGESNDGGELDIFRLRRLILITGRLVGIHTQLWVFGEDLGRTLHRRRPWQRQQLHVELWRCRKRHRDHRLPSSPSLRHHQTWKRPTRRPGASTRPRGPWSPQPWARCSL
jgi:hypothetical protein